MVDAEVSDGPPLSTRSRRPSNCWPVSLFGLRFPGPVGLAAGYDRDGYFLERAFEAGFDFVELGTVTPEPEAGHNPGVRALARNLRASGLLNQDTSRRCVVGVSLGKQTATPVTDAWRDYVVGLREAWNSADYLAVNLTSPAALELHEAAHVHHLHEILWQVRRERDRLIARGEKPKPILVKLAIGGAERDWLQTALFVRTLRYEGLIAAWSGDPAASPPDAAGAALRCLCTAVQGQLALVAVGGIRSAQDVFGRLTAGASLVQVYRAFVEQGPALLDTIKASHCATATRA